MDNEIYRINREKVKSLINFALQNEAQMARDRLQNELDGLKSSQSDVQKDLASFKESNSNLQLSI